MAQTFPEPPTVLKAEDARQGIMLGHVRYVLAISLTLAIVAGLTVWLFQP
jgi:hypothetical protein